MNKVVRMRLMPVLCLLSAPGLAGQTFQATQAVHEVKCRTILGIFNKCVTIETDRVHSTFTRNNLNGRYLYGRTWAMASHCTRQDATEEKCKRSVFIATDPAWNRVVWGQSDVFLDAYGTGGSVARGPGHFRGPTGVDITRKEGEWHVGFVADSENDRIVVIAVGYSCRCVRWLGVIDGTESGTRLRSPHDVAWDPADTWSFADDRVFIADTDNHRVVVYQITVDPAAGSMTKSYLNSFGTWGSGATNLSRPQGITVESFFNGSVRRADVYISDTGNERVSLWYYDTDNTSTPGTPIAAVRSSTITGSELVGLSLDYYGDLIVADRARNVLMKFRRSGTIYGGLRSEPTIQLAELRTYGGTPSWSTGNFNAPTDVDVIYQYWMTSSGSLVQEGLPYVQTTEQWTATTGGQLHHLGIDADELAVTPGPCEATFTFLLTAYGDYTLKVKNGAGTVVQSWSTIGASSGRKSEYWNGGDRIPGTYSFVVEHRSAYMDETTWRTSVGPSFNLDCFAVTASAPSSIGQGGAYSLSGSASHSANNWTWQRDDGTGYYFWAGEQNSSFYVPHDPGASYTIGWQLAASRISDGAWDSEYAGTTVYIPLEDGCPSPPCMEQAPPVPGDSARAAPARRLVRPVPHVAGRLRPIPQAGPVRRNHHLGAGAWIGGMTTAGPRVTQLYSFTGRHAAWRPTWPNVLSGSPEMLEEAPEGRSATAATRVTFTPQRVTGGVNAYRVRFTLEPTRWSKPLVALAFDPDLGTRPGDDSLGIDAASGLVWVVDPDSGAVGYLVTDVPGRARVTVRQFSTRPDAWRPDPASDSAAYAELSEGDAAVTAKKGDVRFVIAIGPVGPASGSVDVGLVVLSAASLGELRERAVGAPRSVLALFSDVPDAGPAGTGILRYHFAQAAPEPGAPSGVSAISPSVVPGLVSGNADGVTAPGGLRDDVRRWGITALAFAVPDGPPARVTVRLYDPSGRLLRVLVDDTYNPGAYRVQWDLEDQRGTRVGPGVYIAVMEAPGFRGMARLVVVP